MRRRNLRHGATTKPRPAILLLTTLRCSHDGFIEAAILLALSDERAVSLKGVYFTASKLKESPVLVARFCKASDMATPKSQKLEDQGLCNAKHFMTSGGLGADGNVKLLQLRSTLHRARQSHRNLQMNILWIRRASCRLQVSVRRPLLNRRLHSMLTQPAGAALSLKHAMPEDLPSYPSIGLANTESASGAAAGLANSNPKTVEYWKPGEIPEANRAAILAKDHKGPTLWKPELSAAGSKAALLAQRDGGNVKIWRPEDTDAGHSAADLAMRKKGLSPNAGAALSAEAGEKALVAATGAVSGTRRRSGSTPLTPPTYPDAANSSKNALKAANSVSSRPTPKVESPPASSSGPQIDAARIHNQAVTNLSREMYTSNPPVAPEVEERNRQAGLRAAAVSMAQRMYDVQQKKIEEAAELARSESRYAASTVHHRTGSSTSSDDSHGAPHYANLQEAAQKLAAERLAKLHDEHAAYRQYYGTQAAATSHKLSDRGRTRQRAGSEGELNDEERAQQVRNQMSLFTDKLAQIDHKKRQSDRDLLMAAAQKNVKARMSMMDEKVFNETGKVTSAMMQEWETKARAKAQAESESRMVNHGKVHIGAGKFLDQSEVDAIAAAKVQPTLDEISETAEKQRARDEEIRQQQLERERIAAAKASDEKERADLSKEEWKRFKGEKILSI